MRSSGGSAKALAPLARTRSEFIINGPPPMCRRELGPSAPRMAEDHYLLTSFTRGYAIVVSVDSSLRYRIEVT
jgi:hypothetical protein